MKRLIVGVGGLALFGAGWCFGQAQTAIHLAGGRDWRAATPSMRVYYVAGFMQGFAFGYRDGSAQVLVQYPERLKAMTPVARKDTQEAAAESVKVTEGLLSTKPSSLTVTVAAFYEDDRNMPVCMDKAVILAASSLAGKDATDQEVDVARKKGAESGCR